VSLAAPARGEAEVRTASRVDRFLAAVPLLSVFFWLCLVYAWEAWNHGSPWLFTDELQFTQLARSIAHTGHAARRGQAHSFDSLYTFFTAPAWWIHDVGRAYGAVKDMNVVAMTATLFPTYGLARFVVGRKAALFAATGAAVIPSLVFTSMIVEENVAYPYATLCLFLIAGALLRRTRWWIAGAVVASLVAPTVRGELLAIPAVFVLAAAFIAWQSDAVRRRRGAWSRADWAGFVALVVGLGVLVTTIMGHRSHEWLVATGFYKHRIFTMGLWAAGALMIGLGVFPVVAGLASLWPAPGERFRREVQVFRAVLLASIVAFLWYTAVKAAYLSTVFGTYVVERNLIYVSPVLLIGTALWLERRTVHPAAVAVAAGASLYLILTTPYELQFDLYSQAPGYSVLQWLNRSSLGLTNSGARLLLLLLLAGSVVILLTPRFLPRAGVALALAVATFVLAWNLGGELSAAAASNRLSDQFQAHIKGNPGWIDPYTHGQRVLYLGQQILDPNGEWLLEFWNRSLTDVWSLDGTAPGPGPILTPDLHELDGTLFPDPHIPYVVAEQGIEVVGKVVATHVHYAANAPELWTLYRVAEPLRLRAAVVGISSDGWSGPNDSSYTRYSTAGGRRGWLRIVVSRTQWGGPSVTSHVVIRIGSIVIGPDKEPHLGTVDQVRRWTVVGKEARTFLIRAPGPRFRVEVSVNPKFEPHELVPSNTDRRKLGAVISYTFLGSRPKRR
jgi:hypothetical protein